MISGMPLLKTMTAICKGIFIASFVGCCAMADEIIDRSCHHVQFQQIESKLQVLAGAEAEKYKTELKPLYKLREDLYDEAGKIEQKFKDAREAATSEDMKASVSRERDYMNSEIQKVDVNNQE